MGVPSTLPRSEREHGGVEHVVDAALLNPVVVSSVTSTTTQVALAQSTRQLW